MIAPTCLTCTKPIPRSVVTSTVVWEQRKFCDWGCRRKLASTSTTCGRVEDVEWLLSAGEAPNQVAVRLGLRAHSLGRWLERHGRPDLARPFYRTAWHERTAA